MYKERIIHPSAVSTEFNLWKPARTDFFSHFPDYHQSSYVERGKKTSAYGKNIPFTQALVVVCLHT